MERTLYSVSDLVSKTRALLDLCYKRGTLIGLKQAIIEVKTHELNILKEITKIEEEIKELEKKDE